MNEEPQAIRVTLMGWCLWIFAVLVCPIIGYAFALLMKSGQYLILLPPVQYSFLAGLVLHALASIILGVRSGRGRLGAGIGQTAMYLMTGWFVFGVMIVVGFVLPGGGAEIGG